MYEKQRYIYNEHMRLVCAPATTIGLNPAQALYAHDYRGHLLELGCGNGSFAITLLDKTLVKPATLIDISDVSIDAAKQGLSTWNVDAKCVRCAIEEYVPSETFDTIAFWEGLEHIVNLEVVLHKVAAWLNPRGIFVGSVPDGRICDHETHVQYFDRGGLEILLSRYFGIVEVQDIDLNEMGEMHLVYRCSHENRNWQR